MYTKTITKYLLIIYLLICLFSSEIIAQKAQEQQKQKRLFYSALDCFYDQNYSKALNILYHLDNLQLGKFIEKDTFNLTSDTISIEKIYVKYLIAACYFESGVQSKESVPYIEFVMKSGYSKTPVIVFKDLGDIYHKDYQFDKAIYYYRKFLEKTIETDEFYAYAKRKIEICKNAQIIIQDTVGNEIQRINNQLNTPNPEFCPMLSLQGNILIFSRSQISTEPISFNKTKDFEIYICQKQFEIWNKPILLNINGLDRKKIITVAGISIDGKHIYLSIGNIENRDIYRGKIVKNEITELTSLDFLNSDANELHIWVNNDESDIYFSSNRHKGFGGYDIYNIKKNSKGRWEKARNLGDKINSEFDEINPGMLPDNKTLYFSSNNLYSLGGFDIFCSKHDKEGNWNSPENIGFPVNTVDDDFDMHISGNGLNGYYSRANTKNSLNRDLFWFKLIDNIPLTIINGTLKAGLQAVPIDAQIRIIGKPEKSSVLVNTNPSSNSGKYYLFCPPGNDYDLLIEAKGYMPQIVNIHVPKQDYFYPLNQEILLSPIVAFNKKIGETIKVKNSFYDIYKGETNSKLLASLDINTTEYQTLLETINDITSQTEYITKDQNISVSQDEIPKKDYTKLLSFVEQAIIEEDTSTLFTLNNNAVGTDIYFQDFYYNQNDSTNNLESITINNTIINAPPPLVTTSRIGMSQKIKQQINEFVPANEITSLVSDNDIANVSLTDSIKIQEDNTKKVENIVPKKLQKEIISLSIYFETNSYEIDSKYFNNITEIHNLLNNNKNLSLKIEGFASSLGDDESNFILSEKRTNEVFRILELNNIDRNRIELQSYGEKKIIEETSEEQMHKNQRVDITIVENYLE